MHEADGGDDMALKLTIQSQEDFTGEFPAALANPVFGVLTRTASMTRGFLWIPPAIIARWKS